jgi:hypothetical protein
MRSQACPREGFAAAAAAILASFASPAPADAAPRPNAIYAGGAFTSAAPLVGLRVAHNAKRIAFEAEAIARCTGGERVDERLTVFTPLATSGSFTGRAQRTFRLTAAERRTVVVSVAGVIADARRASGTFRMQVLVRRRGRPAIRCNSRLQEWEARSVPRVPPGPPRPLLGAGYFGTTSQQARFVAYPFALRVSGLGMQVERATFRVRRRCTGVLSGDVPADMPAAPISRDGTFSSTDRYSQRFPDAVEEFSFTMTGRFTTTGAGGVLRATSIVRDPRTRRVIGRCNSGTVSWRAVL